MEPESESEWRVVKGRSDFSEGSKPKVQVEKSRELKDLVGAPILKADVTRWPPAEAVLLKDKIGEEFYLRKPSSLNPVPHKSQEDQYDICDVGEWPTMGVEGAHPTPQLASWSKVVKAPAPIVTSRTRMKESLEGTSNQEGEIATKKSKKKKKPKENAERTPLVLELADILQTMELKKSKKIIVATGGGMALHQQPPKTAPTIHGREIIRGRNALDASAPTIRRGKERETPKKKRPSALRKVIVKEKADRKTDKETIVEETGQSEAKLEEEGACLDVMPIVPPATPTQATVIAPKSIHNRKFREYCDHIVTEEINDRVEKLLTDLRSFQDRQHLKDPTKSKAKRRYVCGLKEVLKHLKLKKIKCVVVPPNLDKIQSDGGINDFVAQIVDVCKELNVPIVFAMSRRRLAILLRKKHRIGCVGIFYYDGAEVHYKRLMDLVSAARLEYNEKVSCLSGENAVSSTPPDNESSDESAADDFADFDLTTLHLNATSWNTAASEFVPWNIAATEFVPTTPYPLNVNAAVFTPASTCQQ